MEAVAGIYTSIIFPDSLSNSEPHLSDIQKAMLDATPDCIKVLSVDGRLLMMNRAGCLALNVPEDSEFGMAWLGLLPEEVRTAGREALARAVAGVSARFPGRSVAPSGTRYWDNLLMPVANAAGNVMSILCVSRDVTANTLLEKELQQAIGREKLLSSEMLHRIKNLFSVVSGLVSISEQEAASEGAPEAATQILRDKVRALARASDVAFAPPDPDVASGQIDLAALIESVLQPYGDRCRLAGPNVSVDGRYATNLALFLHELATNSVKHGALGGESGTVSVRWSVDGKRLILTWAEIGGPLIEGRPAHTGFGNEMADRIVKSIGGTVRRTWLREGLLAELQFPRD